MDKNMILGMACDHAGYQLKERIRQHLMENGFTVKDFGTNSEASADYPDFVHPLGYAIDKNELQFGIVICGSGNGVSITANKHPKVRAALCWNAELARLARNHNDANVLALPARFISQENALEILEAFLNSDFEGGRHSARVNKIALSQ